MKRAQAQSDMHVSLRRHAVAAGVCILLLAGGVGGWASTSELSGAVIAQGQLVVDSSVKKVQHPTGGVVGELRVREGDHVHMGDILLRLDDTQTRANLAIITKGLDELAVRKARSEAERDAKPDVTFPRELARRALIDSQVERLLDDERTQFRVRRTGREGQKAQLTKQIAQYQDQIDGLKEQITAKEQEIQWAREELGGVRELWKKNLVQITRVTALERDVARLTGERGSLIATIAQAKNKISETELKILQVDEDLRTEVGKDLGDIRAKMSELVEKRISAEDQLNRVDIRAPQSGMVHQLTVHTVGGVVLPQGDPIMLIVPEHDSLLVEAKIQPQDIDQVRLGQPAILRFSAFNQRTTPEINGEVSLVSADTTQDPKTGVSYYMIRIRVKEHELARLDGLRLVPGMPVEAFVQTGARTMLSYLVRPLRDQFKRAFREN
jgi:HlyD family secretion protein